MGGGHSRELELAQQQVARLTKDLKKVSTELVFKESALAAAIKKAPAPQADEQLKRQLAAAEAEAANYKQMTRDAPFLREQLQRAQRSGDEKLQGAQSELLAAKRELERVTGELKFAHQEQRTLGRLQADLSTAQRELSAEHDRAERLSAKLVAEANAALLDESAAAEGSAHPVFGELLHDFATVNRARMQEALDDDAALATELADDAPTTPGGPLDALADAELDLEFERLVHSASKW